MTGHSAEPAQRQAPGDPDRGDEDPRGVKPVHQDEIDLAREPAVPEEEADGEELRDGRVRRGEPQREYAELAGDATVKKTRYFCL